MSFLTLDDVEVKGKRVLVRLDLSVPLRDGVVTDATRLTHALSTLQTLQKQGARVIILSHFGRPNSKVVPELSLQLLVKQLAHLLGKPVSFAADCGGSLSIEAVRSLLDGDILLLENTRFYPEEEANDPIFSQKLAALGDIYVNDAFPVSHRAHASTVGIADYLPAYAGRGMAKELEMLSAALAIPVPPVVAVVGGAKISSKLSVLNNLLSKVNTLVIGGGMANTFLAAQGTNVGISLCEKDLLPTAREILAHANQRNVQIFLPVDVVVSQEFKAGAPCRTIPVTAVADHEMILDAGEETIACLSQIFEHAKTVLWNGPLGAFEIEPFDKATVSAAKKVAELTLQGKLLSVAGGGDTVAALNHAGVGDRFTYLSTAGGAFLEWLEGRDLPGVEQLKISAQNAQNKLEKA